MTYRIGVISVRGMAYHPTRRLAEAAAARDAQIIAINPYEVQPAFELNRPFLYGAQNASGLQAVLPRQGAEIKTACLPLIAHFEQMGVRVINGLASIQMARNKFFMLQALTHAGLPVPNTVFATSMDGCRQAREYFAPHPAVLKPINGRQGTGLHCLAANEDLPQDIPAQFASGRGVLVQAYIPPRQRRDFRVLVVGGQVAGAIMLKPPEGDFRTNAHIGGQAQATALDAAMADQAVRAAGAMGLEIAGVDLIFPDGGEPMVIEVNSAPGFRALEAATEKDIAGTMVDYVLSVCKAD